MRAPPDIPKAAGHGGTLFSSGTAGTTVPGGGPEHWIDPAAFFSRGTSGQWRDLLDDADLARYAARVRALASGSLVEWVHREPID